MFIGELLDSIVEMPGRFLDVALHDPLAALMLVMGVILVTVSVGAFGLLVAGSVVELLTPSPSSPPQQPER